MLRQARPDLRRISPGRQHDETEYVVQHYQNTLKRALDFFGYTIDDVVNDAARREHVKRACLLSFRIRRDLVNEPWRTEATERLAEVISRRLRSDDGPHAGRTEAR